MPNYTPKLTAADLVPDIRLRKADKDAFRHAPIAAQVADLAAQVETPVNIALFGPWGSGKSSFFELLRSNLEERDKSIRLVRYDAWRFGGASLKRNFLSNAANELGFHQTRQAGHDFNLGLYETKKTVRFDPVQIVKSGRWKPLAIFALIVLVLTGLAILAVAGVTSIGPEDFSDELGKIAPGLIKIALGGVVAAGAAAKFLDGARIESQQSQPSEDEEFAELFTKLSTAPRRRALSRVGPLHDLSSSSTSSTGARSRTSSRR